MRERAEQTLEWAKQNRLSLLTVALDHLSLGRAHFGLALTSTTPLAAPGEEAEASAVRQLIERVLMLQEVARLQVREPTAEAIEVEVSRLRASTTGSFERLLTSTGYDLAAVRELARESLRIDAYLRQRSGQSATPHDADVGAWLANLRSRAQVEIVPAPR